MFAVFILSFAVTAITLIFKLADTRYDMLVSLVFPVFKFLPFGLSARDSLNTAMEFKSHLIHDTAQETNTGKLISTYRLYDTFL